MIYLSSISASVCLQSILGCGGRGPQKEFPSENRSSVYKSTGDDPKRITAELIDKIGGIEKIIDKNDIVILKPNSQWWNQGMTNTDVMAAFIKSVLAIPGFDGEIIITDSHQDEIPNSRAWTTKHRNGRFNYNELVEYFNGNGHPNVTKYIWHPAGPNPTPLQMKGSGDNVIAHPSEGDGYIWNEDIYYQCPYGNKSVLAYPVFTSAYSGVTIDLKDGAFKDKKYTGQPIKFINFSVLNHHGRYTGVTASVKNYMGVVDMSCGYPAPNPVGTFNTHHVGASFIFRLLTRNMSKLKNIPGFYDFYLHPSVFRFKYTGGVLGSFMREIRKADLNIITAINVGWGSRTDTSKAQKTDTVLASTDPVALDYWAAKNVLLPATKTANAPETYLKLNNPSIESNPFREFLEECRREIGGTISPEMIDIY
jgi:hypothetical protein